VDHLDLLFQDKVLSLTLVKDYMEKKPKMCSMNVILPTCMLPPPPIPLQVKQKQKTQLATYEGTNHSMLYERS
jgi:hypothetical protein